MFFKHFVALATVVSIMVGEGLPTRSTAGESSFRVAIPVRTQGLDLRRTADSRKLYQKLKYAAYVACTRAERVGLEPVPDRGPRASRLPPTTTTSRR